MKSPGKSRLIFGLIFLLFISYGCSTIFAPSKSSKTSSSYKKKASKKRSKKKRTVKKRRGKKALLNWPVKGLVTSGFGKRNGRRHEGIDIAAPLGTKIRAVARGEVIFSGWGPTGYGKMIIIRHSAKFVSVYAHNSKNIVKKGKRVKRGSVIGYVGKTGRATGPHLHFEIRSNLKPVNPVKFLRRKKRASKR